MANERDKQPGQSGDIQGEGDRRSARRFNEESRKFVEKTDVDEKARKARPRDSDEERELTQAEKEAAERAKEHDPNEVRGKGPA
jgi:hypothetical protein